MVIVLATFTGEISLNFDGKIAKPLYKLSPVSKGLEYKYLTIFKVDLTAEQQSDDELFAKDLRQLIASVCKNYI